MADIIYINGKFTAQQMTGVQRAALNLVLALDQLLHLEQPAQRWVLLVPHGSPNLPALRFIELRRLGGPLVRSLHAWEQIALPWAARDGRLLSLAGSAPCFGRRQVCMLHDAAVFDHPEAYTRAFATWYRFLFRRLSRKAHGLLTPSAFSAARLSERLGQARFEVVPGSGEHILGFSADDSLVARLGLLGRPFFLAVASANPTKNLSRLLRAHAAWRGRDQVPLVLVGGSNSLVFRSSEAEADEPGLLRCGPVSDEELRSLYQHATALVFPSLYEGFGIPPLEAMHCGCPVIASNSAALPEVCGDAAMLVDPLDEVSIRNAMESLCSDPGLPARLRSAGLARAGRFSWQDSAKKLRQMLSPTSAS